MIEAITLMSKESSKKYNFNFENNKIVIDCEYYYKKYNSFDIEIVFTKPIISFRNHDYTWVDCKSDHIANEYCPKIILLDEVTKIQANITLGFWEVNHKKPHILYWRFNPNFSKPLTEYVGLKNNKRILQADTVLSFDTLPALLITKGVPIEFSRSKIPFTAIACFTDHCDFDTLENLEKQREFFKSFAIRITKGVFLNHFSKREDNASFENNIEEYTKWLQEGHELCYHSLSQSIKEVDQSFLDFENFIPPLNNMITWIDHGYQPYNFSLIKNNLIPVKEYETHLCQKNIQILWNYIDSGTATLGVINQMNPQNFTLASFIKGTSNLSFLKKIQLLIKNTIFHFYGDEKLILKYKYTATHFKNVFLKRKISFLIPFLKDITLLGTKIIVVFISWNKNKNKPYKLAKYAPILFKHKIFDKQIYVFQTIEMLDFKMALNTKNIDILEKEKGVFIAHTYFSVPMNYHQGKLFDNGRINQEVAKNFHYLGAKIRENRIWNPTLKELVSYWSNIEHIVFDIDAMGVIYPKIEFEYNFRKVV